MRSKQPFALALIIALTLFALTATHPAQAAQDDTKTTWFLLTDDEMSRPQPVLDAETPPLLPQWALVQATGKLTAHWFQVTYDGQTTWVLRDNLMPTQAPPLPAPPAPAPAPAPVTTSSCYNVQCEIIARANQWGVSSSLMLAIANCESGYNPAAYNPSGASGLYQWMPTSFWSYASQIGETRSYWDADAAANVAAYTVSIGGLGNWDASRPCWG